MECDNKGNCNKNLSLHHVSSKVHDYEQCKKQYIRKDWAMKFGTSPKLCVSLRTGNSSNTNKGDSGSPILSKDKKFLGITSYGEKGLPDVCTLVSHHTDFILNPRVGTSYISKNV